MNNVLVIGITGKSGEYFLRELVDNSSELVDYHFKFFVRPSSKSDALKMASETISAEKYVGDLGNEDDITQFFGGGVRHFNTYCRYSPECNPCQTGTESRCKKIYPGAYNGNIQ